MSWHIIIFNLKLMYHNLKKQPKSSSTLKLMQNNPKIKTINFQVVKGDIRFEIEWKQKKNFKGHVNIKEKR